MEIGNTFEMLLLLWWEILKTRIKEIFPGIRDFILAVLDQDEMDFFRQDYYDYY